MIFGFKDQFVPYVLDGTKTHTIRAPRVPAPRVGMTAHCYANVRTNKQKLLGAWPIVRIEKVEISHVASVRRPLLVAVNQNILDAIEMAQLFWRDGFRTTLGSATAEAFEFWRKRLLENAGSWTGLVIHWKRA
jgi:hypothetical protein